MSQSIEDYYCNRCIHRKDDLPDICNSCMDFPPDAYSHKPMYFVLDPDLEEEENVSDTTAE